MAYKMMNARVETLTQWPAFRGLLSQHRALVPACGYDEWQGEGREKTPYDLHPQDDQYLACAGLYDVWPRPDGEELCAFTIITTEADPFMARLHHRAPQSPLGLSAAPDVWTAPGPPTVMEGPPDPHAWKPCCAGHRRLADEPLRRRRPQPVTLLHRCSSGV
jgi:putative SOS response-associated peptidase YedK